MSWRWPKGTIHPSIECGSADFHELAEFRNGHAIFVNPVSELYLLHKCCILIGKSAMIMASSLNFKGGTMNLQSEQINDLAAALAIAQGKFRVAEEDRTNYFKSKYATYESLRKATQQHLSEQGLCVTHALSTSDRGHLLTTQLSHKSGQWIRSEVVLPVGSKGEGTHELGKSITYLKRYSYAALICIGTGEEDEDANVGPCVISEKAPSIDASDLEKIESELKDFESFKGMLRYYKVSSLKEIPSTKMQEAMKGIENMRKQHAV